MKMPETVVVAPFTYALQHDPKRLNQGGNEALLDADQLVLFYDHDQHPMVTRDSVLHELIHGVYKQTALYKTKQEDEEQEEALVTSLAPRILALLRDNPRLVSWLMEGS